MRIFKRRTKWYVDLTDHSGRRIRWAVGTRKDTAENFKQRLDSLITCRMHGTPLDRETVAWLESLDYPMLERLEQTGLLDSERAHVAREAKDQIDDWKQHLENQGRTKLHVQAQTNRVKRLMKEMHIVRWSEVKGEDVQAMLAKWKREGMSTTSVNHYLTALKTFATWMQKTKRALNSPVGHLSRFNANVDIRLRRRALTADECARLINVTFGRPKQFGMTGPERTMLYRLALETGLRWSELRSLKASSFDLESNPPTVKVEAGYSKHRREDVLPLRTDTAAALQGYLSGKDIDAPAFPMWLNVGSKMVRADLEAANISHMDASGRTVDFHALRHTFITNLANSGVHPSVAQSLARHSTITLTMDRYTHVALESQTAALDKLPSLGRPEETRRKAKRMA